MRAPLLFALALALVTGCSKGATDDSASASGGSHTGGKGGDATAGDAGEPVPTKLEFEMVDALAARQEVTLRVRAFPAAVYHVTFALPESEGDPLDAVLSRSETDTNADGIATVDLTAPSMSTLFEVRAASENVSALLALTVTDTGFADVQVEPRYDSALRNPTTWIASAHPQKNCSDLPGIPPRDGSLVSLPAGPTEAPLISRVPANIPVAITLRSGHFLGGCASVASLSPGKRIEVEVPVLNRPIDLAASKLSIKLSLDAPPSAWNDLLTSAGDRMFEALSGTSQDDVDAVLDAMRQASGDAAQAFESARETEQWDALLAQHWGPAAKHALHDAVRAWLSQGQKAFALAPQLLEGDVVPDAASSTSAHLSLQSVAGVAVEHSGFTTPTLLTWSASADDTVTMATTVYGVASQLVAALAEEQALAQPGAPRDAPSALGLVLDCAGSAATLAATGASPTEAYAGCDSDCMTALCRAGLQLIWARGASATGLTPARLTVSATAQAFVGDTANVAGMTGQWLGQLTRDGSSALTKGPLIGAR